MGQALEAPERRSEPTKVRAKQLRQQGLTLKEIAAELGVSVSTIHTWVGGRKRRNTNAIDRGVFLDFLEAHLEEDPERGTLINGRPLLDQSLQRTLYRIRHEDTCPTHATVEKLLHAVGLMITADFEAWAEQEGRCIWANGEPPPGYRDEDDYWWGDLESTDPAWREEALRDAAEHDYELPDGVILSEHAERLLAEQRQRLTDERLSERPASRNGAAHTRQSAARDVPSSAQERRRRQ